MSRKDKVIITSSRFGGTDRLTPNDLKRLVVDSFDQGPRVLIEDYANQPVLMVGLEFSADNSAVESANAIMAGKTEKFTVDANKAWPFERKVDLNILPMDLRMFEFRGSLVSNYLDFSEVRYEFIHRDKGANLVDADIVDKGFTGFTLRAFTRPTTSVHAKLQMLIFPLDKETLLKEHPLARTPCFPGIEIYRSELHLGVQKDDLLDTSFGLNILPCVTTSQPIRTQGPVPTREDIVGSMCGLLRKAYAPEVRTKRSTLLQRWGELKEHGADKLEPREYREEWPDFCPKTAPRQGTPLFSYLIIFCYAKCH